MPSRLGHGLYKKIVGSSEKYFSLYIYNNCSLSMIIEGVAIYSVSHSLACFSEHEYCLLFTDYYHACMVSPHLTIQP